MAQDPGSAPRKKHGFSNPKLRLAAPNPAVKGGRWAQLGFDVYNNNPRIVLHTNDPNLGGQENSFGRFQAPVDHVVLAAIVELIQGYASSKEPGKTKIENSVPPARDAQSKAMIHTSDIWIGRDDAGVIFISVVSKDDTKWPTIKFPFSNSDGRYHKFYKGDGTPYTKAEESTVYAKAWAGLLRAAVGADVVVNYTPAITPFNNGGGYQNNKGGGNWNKGGGGNSNYAKKPAQESNDDFSSNDGGGDSDFGGDDDIPF